MSTSWKCIATITDGQRYEINGLNIWDHKWTGTGRKAIVKDPLYGKERRFWEYEIRSGETVARFAAGEFSNLVWGIYVEDAVD